MKVKIGKQNIILLKDVYLYIYLRMNLLIQQECNKRFNESINI